MHGGGRTSSVEEGFILDVLKNYTPYSSYYRVLKAVEDDPEYDKKKAMGKIRAYVERQPETIEKKAEIIVEHFLKKVYMKIGGKARAIWRNRDEVQRQIEELSARIATSVGFANAVRNGDRQVAQITFNDDIINIVAAMLEEKTEFVQTYFANPDFRNFVNARVFQAAVSQLSSQRI